MSGFTSREIEYLQSQLLGRLATAGADVQAASAAEASAKAVDRVRELVPATGYSLSEPQPVNPDGGRSFVTEPGAPERVKQSGA